VQANTLNPTWPDQPRVNYRVAPRAEIRIEVWDSNSISNHPICLRTISAANRDDRRHLLECDSGATVNLVLEPGRAKLGIGLFYELRSERVFVTRVVRESAAARAGLVKGDEIQSVQGRPVRSLPDGGVQSLINSYARSGLELGIKKPNGEELTLKLREEAMYPTVDEGPSAQ
jgi:hypothetical protein